MHVQVLPRTLSLLLHFLFSLILGSPLPTFPTFPVVCAPYQTNSFLTLVGQSDFFSLLVSNQAYPHIPQDPYLSLNDLCFDLLLVSYPHYSQDLSHLILPELFPDHHRFLFWQSHDQYLFFHCVLQIFPYMHQQVSLYLWPLQHEHLKLYTFHLDKKNPKVSYSSWV